MLPIYTKQHNLLDALIYNVFLIVFAHLHTCNPVHGDAFHTSNAIGHNVLPPGLVSLGSANSAKAHVNPVDGVIFYRAKEAQNTSS